MEQCRQYDIQAELQSRRWAQEMHDPTAFNDRLHGIKRDRLSFENELQHEDAFWTGTYTVGVDGHGNPALTISEIAIPGRVHRQDSHAMVDSMAGYAAYTLDQIEKGAMPHENWEVAREQYHQFRSAQQEILTLREGESFLGFAMNGKTTRDGVGLFHVTRSGDSFHYETRLIGGLTEQAAKSLLDMFASEDAHKVIFNGVSDNPAYMAVRGTIDIDLRKGVEIRQTVQQVLTHLDEELIPIAFVSSCRTTEQLETHQQKQMQQTDAKFWTEHKRSTDRRGQTAYPISSNGYFFRERTQQRNWTQPVSPWGMVERSNGIQNRTRMTPVKQIDPIVVSVKPAHNDQITKTPVAVFFGETSIAQTVSSIEETSSVQHDLSINASLIPKTQMAQEQRDIYRNHRVILPVALIDTVKAEREMYKAQEIAVTATMYKATDIVRSVCPDVEKSVPLMNTDEKSDIPLKGMIYKHTEHIDATATRTVDEEELVVDQLYVVDTVHLLNPTVLIDHITRQVQEGTCVGSVKKLVWMEQIHDYEYRPVEQLEIAQDPTVTIQRLLHFLQKIVKKTFGEDRVIDRHVSIIDADKRSDAATVDDIAYYMAMISESTVHARMFAYVN